MRRSVLTLAVVVGVAGCRQDTAAPVAQAPDPDPPPAARPAAPAPRRSVGDSKAARLIEAVRKGEARWTRLPPGTPEQVRNLERGKAMLQAGDKDSAAGHFEAASLGAVSGARVSALLALGDLERERGRSAETVRLHEQASAIAPGVPEVQLQLGRAYLLVGRTKDAEEALRRAVKVEPRLLAGWVELGSLLARKGRTEDAADAYLTYERYLFDLVRRLEAGGEEDRLIAVDALSLAASDTKAMTALVRALGDSSPAVRASAATALGDSGAPEAWPALSGALATERSPEVRRALLQAADRRKAPPPR